MKNIAPGTGLTLSSDANKIVITGIDAYAKTEVNSKISELVGTAPALLGTLQELSAAINNDNNFSTTMINALANKANISDTFIKTLSGGDNIFTLGNNKRIVAASDNKIKFQTFDNDGTIITDSWVDLASIEWNTNTNKMTFKITDALVVDGTDITTELSAKATTTQLNLKAPIAGPTFSGLVTAPNLTVNTALLVGSTNIISELGATATTISLSTYAPLVGSTFTVQLLI